MTIAARVSWLLNRYAPNGYLDGEGETRVNASRPAAGQGQQFHDLGWPSGPPSADELMQLLLARAKRELSAEVACSGKHHCTPTFARSRSAYDRAMDKIEKTEPKIEFDVDDPDTWPEDDDNSDSSAAAA